ASASSPRWPTGFRRRAPRATSPRPMAAKRSSSYCPKAGGRARSTTPIGFWPRLGDSLSPSPGLAFLSPSPSARRSSRRTGRTRLTSSARRTRRCTAPRPPGEISGVWPAIVRVVGMTSRVRKAVIPAAGLGTRFLPATKATPKEMLPVVDKPAIQYVVEEAVRAGIRDVLVVTGRNKPSLEDHFDRAFELET